MIRRRSDVSRGFSRFEPTPERTAFVRFRRALVAHGLDARLFSLVTEQLRARSVTVKTGTLVDATVIASASRGDEEAAWSGHRSRKAQLEQCLSKSLLFSILYGHRAGC
jgi:IS5 family transposase